MITNASEFRVVLPHLLRYPINDINVWGFEILMCNDFCNFGSPG
jgi:hypothetical protein